jgi:phosphoribosylamine--glycine ligase
MTVVIAAEGYPGTPRSGGAISGIEEAEDEGAIVFQAGTKEVDGKLVASGGRVLAVTAAGETLQDARGAVYAAVAKIRFADGFHRRDIGWRELERIDA